MIEALIDPWPPFTFCCPQAIVDQDAGVSIPNISLLPLDEVPVHVHRFAARVPCDSKGSQCQCGIHTAEAASALRSRKTERAAKEKPTAISLFFLAPAAPGTPTRRHALGRLPTRPLCQKICYQTAQKTALCAPCEHPGGFGIRKSASNSGHSPLRGSGGCSMHCSMQCSTHCRPSLFAAHRR